MSYILLVITIFTNGQGIATHTAEIPFANQAACERARQDLSEQVYDMKGQMGRELIARCYAKE
jgi:hypothetical protein